jgi:hypothetical protein
VPSTVNWVGGPGDWDDPGHWFDAKTQTQHVPTADDDAVIAGDPSVAVTHSAGMDTVRNVHGQGATLYLFGGTLTVLGIVRGDSMCELDGGTLAGATMAQGTTLRGTSAGGTLSGVTVNGTLDLTGFQYTRATVTGGLTVNGTADLGNGSGNSGLLSFSGTQTLGGTGNVVFGPSFQNSLQIFSGSAGSTLTIGPGLTVHGHSGQIRHGDLYSFLNQGTVRAEAAGGTIDIEGVNWANAGSLQATAGTLSLGGNWTSCGTVTVTNAGTTLELGTPLSPPGESNWCSSGTITCTDATVNLNGNFTRAGLGTFTSTGGSVRLRGYLDNRGGTLNLDDNTGAWRLDGGTITGGTVNENGSPRLLPGLVPGYLSGVTLDGDLDLSGVSTSVYVTGGLTLNGTARLGQPDGSTNSRIFFRGTQTLGGTGSVLLGGYGPEHGFYIDGLYIDRAPGVTEPAVLTIDPAVTVHGKNGYVGPLPLAAGSGFVNRGVVRADVPGGTLKLDGTNWTNAGAVEAGAGTTVAAQGTNWANAGTLQAEDGATLNLAGSWSNRGAITAAGATVNLGGSFVLQDAGTLSRTGGAVNLTGVLQNAGYTLTLNETTGSWLLGGGAVVGGTVTEAGGQLLFTGTGGELDGVTFNGDMDLATEGVTLSVSSGLTLNGTAWLGDAGGGTNSRLLFQGSQALDGSALVVFGGGTRNEVDFTGQGSAIGPNVTVRGQNGVVYFLEPGSVNRGTVSADVAGGTLAIGGNDWTSAGTIRATGGASAVVYGTLTNYFDGGGAGTLTGGTWQASAHGTLRFLLTDHLGHDLPANVVTNAAAVVLDGAGANVLTGSGATAALAPLALNAAAGSFTVRNGATFSAAGDFTNSGTLAVGAGSTFSGTYTQTGGTTTVDGGATLASTGGVRVLGGTLGGAGVVHADVTNAGTVAVGDATTAGVLTIDGDYTQTAEGTLSLKVGGPTAGTDYDQLAITGNATLAGTLSVTQTGGYIPPGGARFVMLTFSSVSGMFDALAGDGPMFAATYNATDVTLVKE